MDILGIGVVVLKGDFHRNPVLFGGDMDDLGRQLNPRIIEIFHKLLQSLGGEKSLAFEFPVLFDDPFVGDLQADACIQESQLPEPHRQDLIFVFRSLKNGVVGFEGDDGAGFVAKATFSDGIQRFADVVLLHPNFSVAAHFRLHVR